MRKEPVIRRDGTCAARGCSKKLGPLTREMRDPFHSTLCARNFYRVVFASDEASAKYHAARGGKAVVPSEATRDYMERAIR